MAMIQPDRIIRKNSDTFAESAVADDRLLAPITGDVDDHYAMLNLNEVAAFIWEHIEDGTSERALCNAVIQTYDTDKVTATRDVTNTINELIDLGAVSVMDARAKAES
jgi:hypothetical protein